MQNKYVLKRVDENTVDYNQSGKRNNILEYKHYKRANGYEWWTEDHPDNPKNKESVPEPEYKEPFTF